MPDDIKPAEGQSTAAPAAAPAPEEKPAEKPPEEKPEEKPAQPDPTAELASLRTLLEEVSSKLGKMEAAAAAPGTDPTEAEAVLKSRWEADLAELPEAQQAALKEIAGDSVLVGVKALTALQKAGMVGGKEKPADAAGAAAPSDRQNLDATAGAAAPKTFDEASARIAANLGNMRL